MMAKRPEGGWSKMPVSWQKDPAFQERIRSASQGDAIAALKLYIAMCLKANFHSTEQLLAGCVQLSLTSLVELVDTSRPMVVAGLKLLADWGLIASEGGRPTIWRIVDYIDAPYWVKLPKRPLYGSKDEDRILALVQMPNRRRGTLHALQLYLYLASIRDKHSNKANLSYEQGKRTLGLSRNQFSSALSLLTLELVTVRTALEIKTTTGTRFSSNEYWLRGSPNDPFKPDHADLATPDVDDLGLDFDDVAIDDDDPDFGLLAKPDQPVRPTPLPRLVARGPFEDLFNDD
jgi:hypothetical protein